MDIKNIYLDNSATTKLDERVLAAMMPYLTDNFGNASSLHHFGQEAYMAIDKAHFQVAKVINAEPNEIYFTSGATESNNWAIKGVAYSRKSKGNHIITTKIEHPAILEPLKNLGKEGFEVTYLDVNEQGFISISELRKAITDKTILISIMSANNEIGSIQKIKEIGAIAKEKNILFHTDAVQALTSMKMDVKDMNIDLLSLSAHKFNGPKGVGILYIKNGVRIKRFMDGGEQERKQRATTYNTPAIVGMGKAIELLSQEFEENKKKVRDLRDYFCKRVQNEIPDVKLNGPSNGSKYKTVNNANFSFAYIEGESILMRLDLAGIAVSSGSACSSGSLDPSHVLLAVGLKHEVAHGSIRFSFGKYNTKEEIDYVVEELKKIVKDLRELSPIKCWNDIEKM